MPPLLARATAIILAALILPLAGCESHDSSGPSAGTASFTETFTGTNGSAWPAEWMAITTSRANATIENNRGRLQHDAPPIVARVVTTTVSMTDFEATFTIRFEDFANQGIGFYGRQNGGHLQTTTPHGQGYVIFTEGFGTSDFGFWEEVDGVETRVFGVAGPLVPGGIQNGTDYRVRFRVEQMDASTTLLRARIWPTADSEPGTWTAEFSSTTGVLQNAAGGFAVDLYNYSGSAAITIDDIQVTNLD